jgi:competence protein ComEA
MMKTTKILAIVTVLAFMATLVPMAFSADAGKVNINKASVDELMQLEKVGETYAQRIVEYREKNGPFKTPEDIMNVKGIGEKIFSLNKDRITVK